MSELFEKLQPYLDRGMAIGAALVLFDWDNETLAPACASEKTAKIMGNLSGEYYRATINDEVRDLLEIGRASCRERV